MNVAKQKSVTQRLIYSLMSPKMTKTSLGTTQSSPAYHQLVQIGRGGGSITARWQNRRLAHRSLPTGTARIPLGYSIPIAPQIHSPLPKNPTGLRCPGLIQGSRHSPVSPARHMNISIIPPYSQHLPHPTLRQGSCLHRLIRQHCPPRLVRSICSTSKPSRKGASHRRRRRRRLEGRRSRASFNLHHQHPLAPNPLCDHLNMLCHNKNREPYLHRLRRRISLRRPRL